MEINGSLNGLVPDNDNKSGSPDLLSNSASNFGLGLWQPIFMIASILWSKYLEFLLI